MAIAEIERDAQVLFDQQDGKAFLLQFTQEVRQSRIERDAAVQSLEAARKAVAAARESLELSRLRFTSGLATSLDTVVAQGSLADAEDLEIRSLYQYQLARARMATRVI